MNYQPNQILLARLASNFNDYFLVIAVYSDHLTLKSLSTGKILRPSLNSCFIDYCTLIGTTDSHPELLI